MADTHAQIVKRGGKDQEVAERIGAKPYQVRDWRLRNSIPSEHWKAFSDSGIATLEELAEAAAQKVSSPERPGAAAA
jgi:hypothetical protein